MHLESLPDWLAPIVIFTATAAWFLAGSFVKALVDVLAEKLVRRITGDPDKPP